MALAYPRWIVTKDGVSMIVHSADQHAVHTGMSLDAEGNLVDPSAPVAPPPSPPKRRRPSDSAAADPAPVTAPSAKDPLGMGLFSRPKED